MRRFLTALLGCLPLVAGAEELRAGPSWQELEVRVVAGEPGIATEVAAFVQHWTSWVADGLRAGEVRWVPELEEAILALRRLSGIDAAGPEPSDLGLVERIRLLPAGGSNGWDHVVRSLLVDTFDTDGSGVLDRSTELESVPCEAWVAVDEGVRQAWPSGLYVTYGFAPDLVWIGDALGLDPGMRQVITARLGACAVPTPQLDGLAPFDPERMAEALASLPAVGSPPWVEVVRTSLLGLYDGDRSGDLDSAAEANEVPCGVWVRLDAALREEVGEGILPRFAFGDADRWSGPRLGFEGTMRAIAREALTSCGLDEAGAEAPEAPALALSPFDLDHSGRIDRRHEVAAVPCTAWRALDATARTDLGVSAAVALGAGPGLRWAGGGEGIDASMRAAVRRALGRCAQP